MAKLTKEDVKKLLVDSNKSSFKVKTVSYNIAKIVIVSIVALLAIVGCLGSTHWGIFNQFNMIDYAKFLESYGGVLITFIGSIGLGGAVKNGMSALSDYKKALKVKK